MSSVPPIFGQAITAQNATYLQIFRQGVAKAGIGLDANDQLALMAGMTNNPAMDITTTGSVGIGTASPNTKLDVYTSAGVGAIDLGKRTVFQYRRTMRRSAVWRWAMGCWPIFFPLLPAGTPALVISR
jgi:hypothetical protein